MSYDVDACCGVMASAFDTVNFVVVDVASDAVEAVMAMRRSALRRSPLDCEW